MTQFVIWLFGIILAVVGVLGSIHLNKQELLDVVSYRTALPTLNYIAFTACVSASAEAFETALRVGVAHQTPRIRMLLVVGYLMMAVITLIFFFVFARSVIDVSDDSWSISRGELFKAFGMIVVAVIANWGFKRGLVRLENAHVGDD